MLPSATLISTPGRSFDRDAERERKRVGLVPGDLGDVSGAFAGGSSNSRPDGSTPRRHVGEPHRPALARIGVLLAKVVGLTTSCEHEHVAGLQRRMLAPQRGARRPARQAAAEVAPGVERRVRLSSAYSSTSCAVSNTRRAGSERVAHVLAVRLEPHRELPARASASGVPLAGSDGRPATVRHCTQARALQPSCSAVVDQPRMAPHRDALARGREVGLVGDRVLAVGQVVGGVGQQLDQRDAEVGRRTLASSPAPAGSAGRASAGGSPGSPWPGSRCRAWPRPAGGQGSAAAQSKSRRALDLEREVDVRQQRIEVRRADRRCRGRRADASV